MKKNYKNRVVIVVVVVVVVVLHRNGMMSVTRANACSSTAATAAVLCVHMSAKCVK